MVIVPGLTLHPLCAPVRHLLHVHHRGAVHAEAVPEETPRHQRQRLHRLRLSGRGHLLLCAGSGELHRALDHTHARSYTHTHTHTDTHRHTHTLNLESLNYES